MDETKNEPQWMYEPIRNEQFFFMHIPKTGGTTFRNMLTNHFPEGSYYPTKSDLLKNGGRYLTQEELLKEGNKVLNKPLIMGHYKYELAKFLDPKVKVIVFLRNPMDRILSHIRHIMTHNKEWQGVDTNTVIQKNIKYLNLVQSRYLGFQRGAFKNLESNINNIDFIGILEYFDESISLFNKVFNQNLKFISPQNKSKIKLDEISDKSMSLLLRSIIIEVKTYKKAYEHFQKNCLIHNINLNY